MSFLSNTGNKGQREQGDLENKHENYHLLITSLQNSDNIQLLWCKVNSTERRIFENRSFIEVQCYEQNIAKKCSYQTFNH